SKVSHHSGAKILNQHIGSGDESADRLDRIRRFEIERDAFLAGVKLAEACAGAVTQWRSGAHHIAVGGLDLDHFGAEIGEHAPTVRTGNRRGEIEHAKTVQSAIHPLSPSSTVCWLERMVQGMVECHQKSLRELLIDH